MSLETYFELTKRAVPIIKNEAAYLSWRNSVITVRTTKRVNFIEFSYNLECLEREIDFTESSIFSPKNSPATEVCKPNFLKSEMRNVDYTEMIVNSSFWPHNSALAQEMTSVVMCKWSPVHFSKSECVLAVLNNIGGVEFFCQKQLQWKSILNLSPYFAKILRYNRTPVFFEELKESVNILESSAICWAPELNEDNSCYFVTAQKNGLILFWQIFSNMVEPKLRGRFSTDLTEITAMKWIPKGQNNFYLICSNFLGLIHIFDIEIDALLIKLLRPHVIWPHKDKMMAASLKHTVIDNQIVFICSKHRHLLIQVINDNGKVVSEYLKNVNDYRITDIAHAKDGIYLSTVNVKIYKINISLLNGKLNVDLDQVVLKDSYPTYELYSLRFSSNNLVCALAMVNRKVLCRKEAYKMEVVFVSTDSKLESIVPTLLSNPSKKLTYYWDCVELLRFQITKLKIIPKLDYDELYASQDVYMLKIYLIVMTYLTGLRKVLRVCNVTLPETSQVVVKEKILHFYAVSLLNSLFEKCQIDGQLCDLEMECLYGCKNYLEYYSKKYETAIAFDRSVLSSLENNCEYVCQCCPDKIEGFSCKNGHLNMFCMESFTPITTDDYLVCRCCGSTARTDLEFVNPLCVFCDLNLVKPD